MPGLIDDAGDLALVIRITQDKTVFPTIFHQPFLDSGIFLCFVQIPVAVVHQIKGQTQLMLAGAGDGHHGAGKTTTLMRTIERLKNKIRIGVMEADIDSSVDAHTISTTGVKTVQLHTGGMCHLDAEMTRQGLEELGTDDLDLAILENVGNLVSPAEFDTGAVANMAILSVPEGHDKPLKYPLMFQVCSAVIINKIDVAPYFDFDMDKCTEYIRMRNPDAKIFPISAKTGEGVEAVAAWLREEVTNWKK